MNTTAQFWPVGQNEEWLTAPAGATILLISAYPVGWDGSQTVESLDFEAAGWTQHHNFVAADEYGAFMHVKVLTRVLTEPLGVDSPQFHVPINPSGHQPSGFEPSGGYVMLAFSEVNQVLASFAVGLPSGLIEPLQPINAPEGSVGVLAAAVGSQSGAYGPPDMIEIPGASWFSPPYSQLLALAFVETGLPGGSYHRDWDDPVGTVQRILLVVS